MDWTQLVSNIEISVIIAKELAVFHLRESLTFSSYAFPTILICMPFLLACFATPHPT
jgi:hypothetical protein